MILAGCMPVCAAMALFCLLARPEVFAADTNIGGFVRNPAGKPISDAQVTIVGITRDAAGQFLEAPVGLVKTDASGKWSSRLTNLSALTFRLSHSDHKPIEYELETAQAWGTNLVRRDQLLSGKAVMIIAPGDRVDLAVTTTDGKPVSGAIVYLITEKERSELRKTEPNGRAALFLLDDREMKAVITARGFAPAIAEISAKSAAQPLNVQLAEAKVLKGRVVDSDLKPVPGALVELKTWKSTSVLDWKTETDSDGRFTWNDSPAEGLRLAISKDGYLPIPNYSMNAGAAERTITLLRPLIVTGVVIDADTKKPIPEFNIYKGSQFTRDDPMRWRRDRAFTGTNGQFTLNMDKQRQEDGLVVEADGYLPVASPAYEKPDTYTNVFELKKGSGISAVVTWPEGKPAPGATVVLVDAGTSAYMDKPGEFRTNASQNAVIASADEQGKFQFPPRVDAHTIFAIRDDGYAEVRVPKVIESGKVILQRCGRVKGVLRVRDTTETNLTIALHTMRYRYGEEGRTFPPLSLYLKTTPDEQGNFEFERVPPGERKIYLQYKFLEGSGPIPLSHGVTINVKAGETAEVTLGGTGRTLIGKITSDREIDWRHDVQRLTPKIPDPDFGRPAPTPNLSSDERKRAWADYAGRSREFWLSEKGRELDRQRINYIPVFAKDGSFRIPNVPAGKYELVVEVNDPTAERYQSRMIGSVRKDIVVPEGTEAFDIGNLELVLTRPQSAKAEER